MRAIVQRVMKASVSVGDELISSVERGLCVLVGISRDDTAKDMEYIVRKILNLRVFDDEQGKRWEKSVMDKNYEVLCVSQWQITGTDGIKQDTTARLCILKNPHLSFTLYSVLKGNKPDFHSCMGGDESKQFYENFLAEMKKAYKPDLIKDGQFGAFMQVHIQNDGPVTITIESPVQEAKPDKRGGTKSKEKKSEKTNILSQNAEQAQNI